MTRCSLVLLCVAWVGCGGTAPSIRHVPDAQRRCVYLPPRDEAAGAWKEEVPSARAGVQVVLVAATAGASPMAPPAPNPAPALEGLSGEGLGTSAAADGANTPIEIADKYYGTHFGDVKGWVQGQYPSQVPSPGAAPEPRPDESAKKQGRVYVTYTKLNKRTHRYYTGRTSMIVDLAVSLEFQAALAVLLRDRNHHLDENAEPEDALFSLAQTDRFDVGIAVDYRRRYDDVAYWRIRGREQQLMDSLGGAHSDTGEPYRTENAIRGVARDNPQGRRFHAAATELWGQLHPYTGF